MFSLLGSYLRKCCAVEMVDLIHSSKDNSSILRWHESVLSTAVFAKKHLSDEFDFGLSEACVQALSTPRYNAQSDRQKFLQSLASPLGSLLESGILEGEREVSALCPPEIAAEILLARSTRREAVISGVLCGRVDVLKALWALDSAASLLESGAEGLDPLELALYLSGRKDGGSSVESGLPKIKKNLDEYLFALDWLTLASLDDIISFLVTHSSTKQVDDSHLSEISISTLESKAESLLGIACLHGNEKHVDILINSGADVNARIALFEHRAPLHIAAVHGNENIVRLLLRHGAVPNMQDREGNTALHLACNTSDGVGVVNALLGQNDQAQEVQTKAAANINIPDSVGWTALHHVASNGNVECCRLILRSEALSKEGFKDLLLAADYERGSTALHVAAESGHPAIIEEILNAVKARDVEWPVEMCKRRVQAPTKKGASSNQDQDSETFVSCNAVSPYVNFCDLARYSALHRACAAACDSFISLSKQAEEKQDKFDKACLCVEVLVENGADCLVQTVVGYVPLHHLLCGSQGGKNRMDDRLKNNDLSYVAMQKSQGDQLEPSIRRRFSSVDLLSNEWKENTLLTRPLSVLLNSAPSAIHISGKDSVTPLHCAGK